MKTIALLTSLLFLVVVNAETIKPEIVSGDTLTQYAKPGAPITMKFDSVKVDVNETSDVNITLNTTVTTGTLSAIVTLDKALTNLNNAEQNLSFEIRPNEQEFALHFEVSAKEQGLYYIRLLTKINNRYGKKLRSFAIPVYIGEERKKNVTKSISSSSLKAFDSGENLSVSKAVETVKVLKTNK